MSSREKDVPTKQESNPNQNEITKVSSSSRPWSGLNNPRIVRVSRSFGGKDRHSKVCTIKGLRDRRVRLSVPTAIQLYDLQDRLGLNQPSKVVDWLLNVAKHDIDKLPPLTMPLGFFGQYPQSMVVSHEASAPQSSLFDGAHSLLFSRGGIKINNNVDGEDQTTMPKPNYRNFDSRDKCKEVVRETSLEKTHWIKRNEEDLVGIEGHRGQSSAPNSFLKANNSSLPSFLNNIIPYNSHYHWEPSDLSLSHVGSQGYHSYHTEDPNCYNVVSLSSSLPPSSGSQLLVCPSGTTPSFLPPYVTAPMDFDPRQTNHFQMLSSSTQHLLPNSLIPSINSISPPMRPLPLSITHKFLHSQNNRENQSNKENGGLLSTPTASFFQNDPKPTL